MKNSVYFPLITLLFVLGIFAPTDGRAQPVLPISCDAPVCLDFTNNQGGFTSNDVAFDSLSTNEPLNAGNQYLKGDDDDGPSFLFNDSNPSFQGDLSCAQICFDYNIEADGWELDTAAVRPSITIYSGSAPDDTTSLRASFVFTTTASESTGWDNYCVNIPVHDTAPAGWNMRAGTEGQWPQLITNVTGIAFTTDISPGNTAGETIGIDNVCICSRRPVPIFHFEDIDGNIQDVFCEGEDVILNGSASLNDNRFFVAIEEITPGGDSLYLIDTGYIWHAAELFNLTDLMEMNDDNYFKAGYTYRIKFVVGNYCDGWVDAFRSFTVESLNHPDFPRPSICRVGDNIEVTLIAANFHENHMWQIYLGDVDDDCPTDPLPGPPVFASGNIGTVGTWTFTTPYVPGQCVIVKHGTWSEVCPWREVRKSFNIPEIPLPTANFDISSTPLTDIWYDYTYQAHTNSFAVDHEWTIEESLEPDGPWDTPNFSGGLNTPTAWAYQSLERYYRITHWVRAGEEENFCTENRMRVTIHPQGEDGLLTVTDERGERIGSIDPNREPDDRDDDDRENGGGERFSGGHPGTLDVFPNPATDHFTFRLDDPSFLEGFSLQLIGTDGQIVLRRSFGPDTFSADLHTADLPAGLYQLRLFTAAGDQLLRKVVIQH